MSTSTRSVGAFSCSSGGGDLAPFSVLFRPTQGSFVWQSIPTGDSQSIQKQLFGCTSTRDEMKFHLISSPLLMEHISPCWLVSFFTALLLMRAFVDFSNSFSFQRAKTSQFWSRKKYKFFRVRICISSVLSYSIDNWICWWNSNRKENGCNFEIMNEYFADFFGIYDIVNRFAGLRQFP